MELITVNFSGKVRKEILGGREHLVAQMTMIVPGVLNGSQGPLLYPPEEVAKNAQAWNGIPLTLGHPESKSARDPSVINAVGLGTVYNAHIDGLNLVAEGWFDVERTQTIENSVFSALVAGDQIELSTGLYIDKEPVDNGEWNGTTYTHKVKNFKPDHLAILIDQRGACSLEEGCGVNNKLSDEDKRDLLRVKLHSRLGLDENDFLFIVAVFKNSVIYEHKNTLFDQKFSMNGVNDVELSMDSPVSVKRMTSFEPVSNAPNKEDDSMSKLTDDQRSSIVKELVSNCDCWKEDDAETLNGFSDDKLVALQNQSKELAKSQEFESVVNAAKMGFEDKDGNHIAFNSENQEWTTTPKKVEEPTTNSNKAPKPMTTEEWYAQAPEEVRNTFAYAKSIENKERESLIAKLVKYTPEDQKEAVANEFRKDSIERLRKLEAIVPERVEPVKRPSYAGSSVPTENFRVDNDLGDDLLELPNMDFD